MKFNFFKIDYKNYINQAKEDLFKNFESNYKVWDPSNLIPSLKDIKEENVKDYAKYLFLKNNPNFVKNNIFIILFFSFLLFFLSFFNLEYLLIFGIIFLILPLLIFYLYLYMLRKDVVKLVVANENNFLYWPNPDKVRWHKYAKLFPEVFSKGNNSQNLEDIFWGEINQNNKKVNFVSGLFNYTMTSYDSENREKNKKYTDHFFIIKLHKKTKSRFFIYPRNLFSRFKNLFNNKKINVESIKFNELFDFSYNGKKNYKSLEIMNILSPRVIEQLIKMYDFKTRNSFFKRSKNFSVLFTENCVVFYSSGFFMKNVKTNFMFSNKINKKDKLYLKNELETKIDLSSELIKYLD